MTTAAALLLLAAITYGALRAVFTHIAARDLQERIRRWNPPKE